MKPPIPQPTFDAQSNRRSWTITIGFHLAALLLMFFATCSPSAPPEELTEIQWGGGGGLPGVEAPVGETPQGEVDGGNREAEQSEQESESQSERRTPREARTDAPDRLPADRERESDQTNQNATENESDPQDNSNAGTNDSDKPQGSADGEGEKPAGGSGGSSVGVGNGNIGRCWEVSPSGAARGQTTTVSGTVNVSVVVKPDGRVIVTGTSGTTSLAGKARSLATRARACSDLGAEDVSTTLTYRFQAH